MEKIYIVYGDGGSYISKVFKEKEDALNYIKNDPEVKEFMEEEKENIDGWEDYFSLSLYEVPLTYEEYEVE